jgi:hypothetical protein
MGNPRLNFRVRIKDRASMAEIGNRITRALGCQFFPSHAKHFEGREALAAEVLGLHITLSYWPEVPEEATRTYTLLGVTAEDEKEPWGDCSIQISEYLVGVLTRRDSRDWYIPSLQELLNEK